MTEQNREDEIRFLKQKLQQLQRENSQLQAAVHNSAAGIVITEPGRNDNPICFANPAFTAMTGYSEAEVLGRNCRFLQGASTNPGVLKEMRDAIYTGQTIRRILVD